LPGDAGYRRRISMTYPTREQGGIVSAPWAEPPWPPELPHLAFAQVPASRRCVTKKWQDCNWLPSLEGALDTAHSGSCT
jgi:hypothetical protein